MSLEHHIKSLRAWVARKIFCGYLKVGRVSHLKYGEFMGGGLSKLILFQNLEYCNSFQVQEYKYWTTRTTYKKFWSLGSVQKMLWLSEGCRVSHL